MCRVQNGSLNSDSISEFPLADITAIFQPSKEPQEIKVDPKINVEDLNEEDYSSLLKMQSQVKLYFKYLFLGIRHS